MPTCFYPNPDGILFMASGMDPLLKWDGLSTVGDTVGVAAPTTAPTIAGSGTGSIVGSYQAYCRFLDKDGRPSNLSPISNTLTAFNATGAITNATNAVPIVITSTAHGLSTGNIVKIQDVNGNTAANATWKIVVIDANNFSLETAEDIASAGNGDYTGGGTWISGVSTINYTNVPLPVESKVVRRQLLRNTDGQESTFYVDVDTTNLVGTSFSSTNTDDSLATNEAVPLLDSDGNIFANRYGLPPSFKAYLTHHNGRMFLAGEINYTEGNVQVTNGSTTVTGIGTAWIGSLAGRFLYVNGATQTYQINTVDAVNQTLTLATAYADTTDKFAIYSIRPAPAQRRLVYFSEPSLPEAWPATNAIGVREDGDEITGIMAKGSLIYFLEKRHIYRCTFQKNPLVDGYVFLSAERGCINNRCWVQVEDNAYMLDEGGIHAFSGGSDTEPESLLIQDIFRNDDPNYQINWSASEFFHAVAYRAQEVIRWFVAMSGDYLPRHAIAYNYRAKRWWIEEYSIPIGASTPSIRNNQSQVYLGGPSHRTLALWSGYLDGPDPASGTVRGSVTSATLLSLADATAAFPSAGIVGNPVVLVSGTGKGQRRTVTAVSGTTLTIDRPWIVMPDTTTVYQLGGIQWQWRSGQWRFVASEDDNVRRVEMHFQPTQSDCLTNLRLFYDEDDNPVTFTGTYTSQEHVGVAVQDGDSDLVVDMTKANGTIQHRVDWYKEYYVDGPRYLTIEAAGVTNADRVTISEFRVDGVTGK